MLYTRRNQALLIDLWLMTWQHEQLKFFEWHKGIEAKWHIPTNKTVTFNSKATLMERNHKPAASDQNY